jgi:hypothetical protein
VLLAGPVEVAHDGGALILGLVHDAVAVGQPAMELTGLFPIRRKGRVQCLFSHDNRSQLGFREFALDYPAEVKIGLIASNLSKGSNRWAVTASGPAHTNILMRQ